MKKNRSSKKKSLGSVKKNVLKYDKIIKLYADGVYMGSKLDTFWSVSPDGAKYHSRLSIDMVSNLITILNSDLSKYYPYGGATQLEIKVYSLNDPEKVIESKQIVKDENGLYIVKETLL